MSNSAETKRVPTGIKGLDTILQGGLPRGEVVLVQGTPGTGKTLLSAQFLRAGVEAGESCLFISLSQDADDLRRSVRGAGLSLEGIDVHDYLPVEAPGSLEDEQVIFHDEHVEFGETVRGLTEVIERMRPDRVVFDGIGYLRLLMRSRARYRRQLLSLRRFFSERDITVMLTDDQSVAPGEGELQSLAYGALSLRQDINAYGTTRRQLRVVKMRGTGYASGAHDFRIMSGGLEVFPRLQTEETREVKRSESLTSGLEQLDALVGGGLEEGTSCLMVGPSGTGKTTLATTYADAAARRGDTSAVYLFDELLDTFTRRSEALGLPVRQHMESGLMKVHAIATGEISPGTFAHRVRQEIAERDVRVVVIDTLTGYLSAMPDERHLVTQMHDLLMYLSKRGVLTILVVAQHGLLGGQERSPVDVSYLADAVVLTRYFEVESGIRQAISVFKKRYGAHERHVRELFIEEGRISVGEPMMDARGVLRGQTLQPDRNGANGDTVE
jgi:circadian clock protein KaiC